MGKIFLPRNIHQEQSKAACMVLLSTSGEGQERDAQTRTRQSVETNSELPIKCPPYANLKKREMKWMHRFEELKAFRQEHGHCCIPILSKLNPSLGSWTRNQGYKYRDNKLKEDQKMLLDEIDFINSLEKAPNNDTLEMVSNRYDANWMHQYEQLQAFKKEHGHCRVPYTYKPNPQLGVWVKNQRRNHKQNKLKAYRKKLLDDIDLSAPRPPQMNHKESSKTIVFNETRVDLNQTLKKFDVQWIDRYKELRAFWKERGHCFVPFPHEPNPPLGLWVKHQRKKHKKNQLKQYQKELLDAVDFDRYRPPEWMKDLLMNPEAASSNGTNTTRSDLNSFEELFSEGLDRLDVIWIHRCQELKAFRDEHRHCHVPTSYEPDYSFGLWVKAQRQKYKQSKLKEYQKKLLVAIGFDLPRPSRKWRELDKPDAQWMQQYEELKAYEKEHGHCRVPQRYELNPSLGRWVERQRSRRKHNKLEECQMTLLDEIGFESPRSLEWMKDPMGFNRSGVVLTTPLGEVLTRWDLQWMDRFNELRAFRETHGHCHVPYPFKPNQKLGTWVRNQRYRYKQNTMKQHQKSLLDEIGFHLPHPGQKWLNRLLRSKPDFLPDGIILRSKVDYEVWWMYQFMRLKAYREQIGHCVIPSTNPLGRWAKRQRLLWKARKLRDDRKVLLDSIDFVWELRAKHEISVLWKHRWMEQFQRLVVFKDKHGHCNVPEDYEEDPKLGHWVWRQRKNWKNQDLHKDRKELLEDLGFEWKGRQVVLDEQWMNRFEELKLLMEQTQGNYTMYIMRLRDNFGLGKWISRQRANARNYELRRSRRKMLDEIGFDWGTGRQTPTSLAPSSVLRWQLRYKELKTFRQKHGHCTLPTKDPEYKRLVVWVGTQRYLHQRGQLRQNRAKLLDWIGLEWSRVDEWTQGFESLKHFREMNGHCRVPQMEQHRKLLRWAYRQRARRKGGLLSDERIKLLDGIGFEWDGLEGLSKTYKQERRMKEIELRKARVALGLGDELEPERYLPKGLTPHSRD